MQIHRKARYLQWLDRLPTDDLDDRHLLAAIENNEIGRLAGEIRQLADRIEAGSVQVDPGEEILDQTNQGVSQAVGAGELVLSDETATAQSREQVMSRARAKFEASGNLGER